MKAKSKHNAVEIATFIFGLVALAAAIGYLLVQLFTAGSSMPNLTVSLYRIPEQTSHYRVSVYNSGDRTAASAQITFERRGTGLATQTTLTLDYVPGKSTREAVIAFPGAPREKDTVVVSSVNFSIP